MNDDFELLRPEDIPPRRRSPKDPEEEEDLLTKELFGDLVEPKAIFADSPAVSQIPKARVVDIKGPALNPREEPRTSPDDIGTVRGRLLRAIETSEPNFEEVREYIEGPILVSARRPRVKMRPKKQPVETARDIPLQKIGHKRSFARPPSKLLMRPARRLARPLFVLLGLVIILGGGAAIFLPLLANLKGGFLGGASFVVPNQGGSSLLQKAREIILSRDGSYLVVETDSNRNSPVGGEPASYALVRSRSGALGIAREGSVAELNAALPAKIIPPEPVQVFKTNFDFFETGWFFDPAQFGRAFGELYYETTGERVGGTIILSSDSPFDIRKLIDTLATGENDKIFEQAVNERELGFYFSDETIASPLKTAADIDTFFIGLRGWEPLDSTRGESGRANVELIEYQPQYFVDGSIVSTLEFRLVNSASAPLNVYTKIAFPKGSILLAANGFADPLAAPKFDYAANGFKENPYVSPTANVPASFFPKLDFFDESGLAVVGGWVSFSPRSSQTLSISYRLPFRLDWQRGRDNYLLNIPKIGAASRAPFRYRAALAEGTGFEWLSPAGYVSGSLAEYQTILDRDQILSATIKY